MQASTLNVEQIRRVFRSIAKAMKEKSDELRILDAACGDGDLGITVTKGFTAIEKRLDELVGEPPGRLLRTLGITFNNAAASTFGVFFATACMYAAKSIKEKDLITVEDLCAMLKSAGDGIATRGQAKVGDKTILDALVPAQQAAASAAEAGGTFSEVLAVAATAAKKGAESTRELLPKKGRARWLGEQGKGVLDPGATFVYMFLDACCDALKFQSEEQVVP